MGPTVWDGAVMWGDIQGVQDLPVGWKDHQSPGQYRLEKTGSPRFFGTVQGPESIKRQAFAPKETLLVIERSNRSFSVNSFVPHIQKTALLGVRACDLAALRIQDRIFLEGTFTDPYYQSRRESLLLIAVNCTRALDTCFCSSMNTGPKAGPGYDLALTESDEDFLVEVGSPAGEKIYRELPLSKASSERIAADHQDIADCGASQTRKMETRGLPKALYDAHDHPQWDEVATRCLACTNCTMVCPTCFCSKMEEKPALTGERTEQARIWDSCFTADHGYIHGKNFRPTIKDRYRMWLTHKLGYWIDQFGTSGCVGCGRCITWCPVGIDLTEELKKLMKNVDEPVI